jgi:phage baseplate assembly protein gpV
MSKTTAVLAMIWMVLSPTIAAADLPPTNSAQVNLSHFEDGDLTCFMRTADGRTLNLNSICGNNVMSSGVTVSSAAINLTGSLGGLEAYRRPVGTPQCFAFDAQGQPCPPIE